MINIIFDSKYSVLIFSQHKKNAYKMVKRSDNVKTSVRKIQLNAFRLHRIDCTELETNLYEIFASSCM